MPIKLLKTIKLRSSIRTARSVDRQSLYVGGTKNHTVGVYVFPGKDLQSDQPLFNDGFPSLILMPDQNDPVRLKRNGHPIQVSPAWVCCGVIQDTHWEVPSGLEYIIVLRFTPSSFYSIFDVKASIFKNNPIRSFEDIVNDRWKHKINKIYNYSGVSERVAYIQELLSAYDSSNLPYTLGVAIDHIENQKGNTTVAEVLQLLGGKVNHKWLHRNFVQYIGISPKKFICLQRFIYTYGQYDDNRPENLSDIALNSGYYDYNHFVKDFKQYMGVAPSRHAWK